MIRQRKMLGWLWPFFAPHRFVLGLVFILAIIGTALELSYPYLSKVFIDDVLIQPKYSLKTILLLTFGLTVFGIVLQLINSYIYLRTTLTIIKKLRLYLFHQLERLRYSFFVRTRVGDITTRLNGDINIVQGTLTDGLLQLCMSVLTLVFITGVLIYLDWKLFLMTLLIFPFLIASLLYFRPKITKKTKDIRENQSDIQGHMIETFGQIRLIKLLRAEVDRKDKLGVKIDQLNQNSLQYAIIESVAGGIPRIITMGMTSIILFLGGMMVIEGSMTLGSLLAFTTYLGRFFSPVQSLAGLYIRFQNMFVSLNRLMEYLQMPLEDEGVGAARPRLRHSGPLFECRAVGKQYGKGMPAIFRNVNLTLERDRSYALVGPSGSGKSSFIDLLVRLKGPSDGTLLFEGQPISDIPVNELRKQVFIVAQEVEILHDTVTENLLLGLSEEERKQITQDEIIRVCKEIGLHSEIENLPEQYETVIGERGKVLSGGQKQRLSIARGLLRKPAVLILDEATSGLDYELERELFKRLHSWQKAETGRMLLVISHRLESLQWVDRWLVVQQAAISEVDSYVGMRAVADHWNEGGEANRHGYWETSRTS
ncbi:ABC transporter ATP-binding protein [Sporosarcina sp. 179-K 3D1 HS]|uniref:ABC transporter ATP-binding protein n=1 Tax=Sporosarcina sp. 179-K 3D1 HS TaxID=3232169 RepID=UPI0039A0706E